MVSPARRFASPSTIAIQGGEGTDGRFDYPAPHIVLNSAVMLESVEEGLEMLTNEKITNIAYQRYSNPTTHLLEEAFARLEDAPYCLSVNSGMTACYLAFRTLTSQGGHVVATHSLYHEISDQLISDSATCGVACSFVTDYSIEAFRDALQPNTQLVFIESPTNPSMLDVDIAALATLCRQHGCLLAVDNTLMTMVYQKPLSLGADVCIYSTTKAINGHGDAMGALITSSSKSVYDKLKGLRDNAGLTLDPFSSYMTFRGMRTLPLRLEQHSRNAAELVRYLQKHHATVEVRHPSLCPHSETNRLTGFGGVVSIVLPTREQGTEFLKRLRLFRLATTFGNLESLVYHFGTFARPSRDITRIGIPLGLVRLSVGLEDVADLIPDVEQALSFAGA